MTRNELIEILPKGGVGIEVGVFKGDFSWVILDIAEPKMLYMLDRFEGYARSGDKDGENIEVVDLHLHYTLFMKHQFNLPNATLLKDDTSVIADFPNDFFDFAYIDADHSYGGVKHDLNAIYPKMKKGGWLMGHDYAQRTKGVIQAVNEFCQLKGLHIAHLTDDKLPSFAIKI